MSSVPDEAEVITVGRLEVRPREFVAAVDGQALELTVRELGTWRIAVDNGDPVAACARGLEQSELCGTGA